MEIIISGKENWMTSDTGKRGKKEGLQQRRGRFARMTHANLQGKGEKDLTENNKDHNEQKQALAPLEERSIDFYGDALIAVLVEVNGEERVYVPVRPICIYLGLSWSGQSERIKRDLVLAEEARFVRVARTNQGGNPNILCLPFDFLNGWLFGINATLICFL